MIWTTLENITRAWTENKISLIKSNKCNSFFSDIYEINSANVKEIFWSYQITNIMQENPDLNGLLKHELLEKYKNAHPRNTSEFSFGKYTKYSRTFPIKKKTLNY